MIKPLADRIVIEVAEVERSTKSGIVIPDTSKESRKRAKSSRSVRANFSTTGNALSPRLPSAITFSSISTQVPK